MHSTENMIQLFVVIIRKTPYALIFLSIALSLVAKQASVRYNTNYADVFYHHIVDCNRLPHFSSGGITSAQHAFFI